MACAQLHLMQATNPSFPHFCWVLFGQRPIDRSEYQQERDWRRRRKGHCGSAPAGKIEHAERFRLIQSAPPSDAQKPRTNASVASLIFSRVGVFKAPLNKLDLRRNDLDDAAKTLVRGAAKEGMELLL